MTLREIFGLVFLIVGTALVPLGWIVSHKILLLAGLLLGLARIFHQLPPGIAEIRMDI